LTLPGHEGNFFLVAELASPSTRSGPGDTLNQYYAKLLNELGQQGWWPARTRLEVILGAILTQNTTWNNAALALKRLRKDGRLTLTGLGSISQAKLESLIRPAGFFRQKALAIRNFLNLLTVSYKGSLTALFARPSTTLRAELLNLRGLGPETVDAILLYAGRQPFFVADAYTRRILARHELLPANASYASAQQFLHEHLPPDHALLNEFHALMVEVGKRYCKRESPRCEDCPLREFLPREQGQQRVAVHAGLRRLLSPSA
jgi:endonuclease-3 related protein